MTSITRVELQNFQAHEHLDLPIGALTLLSGPSNSGKSAVLRAIAGLLRNDSVGPYVRHGASNLKVTLHLSDGHIVTWNKGKTANGYELTRPDGTHSEYLKVGTSVPEDISEVLRIGPITLEDGSKEHINLHEQADSPFLVFDTPPRVAKVFGEMTSAGKLFSAANEGIRRNREDKKIHGVRVQDVQTLSDELSQYDSLEEQLDALAGVQETLDLVGGITQDIESLDALLNNRAKMCADLLVLETRKSELQPVSEVSLELIVKLQKAITNVSGLITRKKTAYGQLEKLSALQGKLLKASKADLSGATAAAEEISTLGGLLAQRTALVSSLAQQEKARTDAQTELKQVKAELGKIETCPTCRQPMDQHVKDQLLHG